jgi:hypothetical protein
VTTNPQNIQVILDWPTPKTIKQSKGFLSLVGYYRRFVKGFRSICRPLTQLLKDFFVWNKDVTEAFNHLKRVMTHPPILALLDHNKFFYGGSKCF